MTRSSSAFGRDNQQVAVDQCNHCRNWAGAANPIYQMAVRPTDEPGESTDVIDLHFQCIAPWMLAHVGAVIQMTGEISKGDGK